MDRTLKSTRHRLRTTVAILFVVGAVLAVLAALLTLPHADTATTMRAPDRAAATIPGPRPARVDRAPAALPEGVTWTTYTRAQGVPSDKVFCVRITPAGVWAGTDDGLAVYAAGAWRRYGVADGLPHRAVLSLDYDARTGEVWVGTMGGLARWSAGRFDVFTQLNSGLSNDFVHAVACDPATGEVWAATAMGVCRYAPRTQRWEVFTEQNTPMHEPWTYSVSVDDGRVYVGAWGGGVLELDQRTGTWREYRDPDKEMEIDLLPDDGPIHDVTAGVAYRAGILWQATYFGLARYAAGRWRSYTQADSGLPSDFINFVRAEGGLAWLCTDDGLAVTDGERWTAFRRTPNGGNEVTRGAGRTRTRRAGRGPGPAHNFVLGMDVQGDEVWVATAAGVSHGRLTRERTPGERTSR